MKKIITTVAFFVFSIGAMAQQDNIDQLQQEPPRQTQAELERAAARDAKRAEAEKQQKEAEEAQKANEAAKKEAERKEAEARKNRKNKAKTQPKIE